MRSPSKNCRSSDENVCPNKVPRIWRFVDLFPQTASSKVQKYALRELYLAEKVA
jgi:acyl-coenzyme A synthetase/AMP-(fatty) acid ligase